MLELLSRQIVVNAADVAPGRLGILAGPEVVHELVIAVTAQGALLLVHLLLVGNENKQIHPMVRGTAGVEGSRTSANGKTGSNKESSYAEHGVEGVVRASQVAVGGSQQHPVVSNVKQGVFCQFKQQTSINLKQKTIGGGRRKNENLTVEIDVGEGDLHQKNTANR